jgi:alkanesulfonate monooxygenase SsuD/methylene tetrahydromethanopterin reductase-like flavin-dependent oxidoreductase (luciferase family)
MFTEPSTTFEGRHFQVVDAINVPLPLSPDGPPVMIGGSGKRFTLPLVARLADISNTKGTLEQLKEIFAELDRLCQEVGRDPGTLWRTQMKPIAVASSHEAAEDLWSDIERRMLFPPLITGTQREVADQLRPYVDLGLDGFQAILPFAGCTPDHIEQVADAVRAALPSPQLTALRPLPRAE